jgi:hypothetical protein
MFVLCLMLMRGLSVVTGALLFTGRAQHSVDQFSSHIKTSDIALRCSFCL